MAISAEKTHEFSRPFITDITRAKIRIDKLIDNELQYHSVQNLTEENIEDEADTVDDNIESTLNLSLLETAIDDKDWLHFNSRKFNKTFKSILVECNVEAKDVINYTLSRLGNKLSSDIKKFDKNFKVLSRTMSNVDYTEYHSKIQKAKQKKEDMIVAFMEELLDVTFFLYASNKRVNTTLKVINILNLIIIHLDNDYEIKGENVVKYSDSARDIVFKKIQDELSLVLKTTSVEPNTQLETLFFLIINKQLRSKYHFGNIELTRYLQRFAEDDSLNALSIIILLYYYGNESRYSSLKLKLVEKIKKKYRSESLDFKRKSAEFCILTLDLITCPYLTYQDKKEIVDLIGINEPELKLMQNHLRTQKYMFTKWTKIDITKELSAKISQEVYA